MFIEFQFGNFRSFRDVTTLTMQAAPRRANDGGLDESHVYGAAGVRMLKSKAIFGANASGKSNVVRALDDFGDMVANSVKEEGLSSSLWNNRFGLMAGWEDEPVHFQFICFVEGTFYRYGFQILNDAVSYEWLFGRKEGTDKEIRYLMRSPGNDIVTDETYFKGAAAFAEQAANGAHEIFRPDALFLTGAALNGNGVAVAVRNEIRDVLTIDGINDAAAVHASMRILAEGGDREKSLLVDLMCAADTGIEGLELGEEMPHPRAPQNNSTSGKNERQLKARPLLSTHSRYDENGKKAGDIKVLFESWESEGTKKIFGLAVVLLGILERGRTLVIDEFDARFHPNLTLKIVELFHDERTNPLHAQLIFVTHDASLLQRAELRRDQIALVDKDKYGASTLTTLIEYKGVRKDASYEKEYLLGNYGAVAHLGKMDQVIERALNTSGN